MAHGARAGDVARGCDKVPQRMQARRVSVVWCGGELGAGGLGGYLQGGYRRRARVVQGYGHSHSDGGVVTSQFGNARPRLPAGRQAGGARVPPAPVACWLTGTGLVSSTGGHVSCYAVEGHSRPRHAMLCA